MILIPIKAMCVSLILVAVVAFRPVLTVARTAKEDSEERFPNIFKYRGIAHKSNPAYAGQCNHRIISFGCEAQPYAGKLPVIE